MDYQSVIEYLKNNDGFTILMHINPDGDTIGSAAALCSALKRYGKHCSVFPSEKIPAKFDPFIRPFFSEVSASWRKAVSVDVAAEELLPQAFSGKIDLVIDHHQKNTLYSENKLVKPMYSSCGEIVFQLITRLCGSLTVREAELLYIAVSTDTGCFQYSNTSFHTLNTAAKLLKYGIDNAALNDLLFRKVNRSRIVLESMIYHSMQYFRNDTVSVATITQKMLEESGAEDEDLDDVASLACRPKCAKLCIPIREREDGKCRVSLRSFDQINCVEICSVFGGGGHTAAAGCTIAAGPEETCEMLLSVIDEVLR